MHPWFELAEIEEVAAVERQLSKQLLGDNPFERCLRWIHAYGVGLHGDCLPDITDLQPHVGCCHSTDLSLEFNNRLFESRCFHAELVEARLKRGSAVDACRGSECPRGGVSGFVNDRYAGPGNDCARSVPHHAGDCPSGLLSLHQNGQQDNANNAGHLRQGA